MITPLEYLTVETNNNPTTAVIWLHGLGADGHDFESIVPALNLPATCSTRFIFPHAPYRAVTINGGMSMRAWYDILEMSLERKVDMDNINDSMTQISKIIEGQIKDGIPSEKIILAGFSQGGVIAYQVGLLGQYKLAGIMALSSYLASPDLLPAASKSVNTSTPILIHHGLQDPVVPFALSVAAKNTLKELGFNISSKEYSMPHSVCPEQIVDISAWLQASLEN